MAVEKEDVVIVGGGPAGLRAAELLCAAGRRVVLADHKPSVGRKFLVAGRGGLNLTHSEPIENFPARYGDTTGRWQKLLADFSPADLRAWVEGLGVETFIGTSGRVFPTTKQAAPLLRRWVERLRKQGVEFRLRHELSGLGQDKDGWLNIDFATPSGAVSLHPRAIVLALGGASWPETGSDGGWVALLQKMGVRVEPLMPANCGWEVDWPEGFLAEAEGLPLKNIVARAGEVSVAGELMITKYGLEGGAIYQLGGVLRGMEKPELQIDLKPSFSVEQLTAKIAGAPADQLLDRATKAWRLSRAAVALLRLNEPYQSAEELAARTKAYPILLRGPRPIAEAISSAGGVNWGELDDALMLRQWPGVFCAGEMIDWEAPTGGYLLQGCFCTATRAARGALSFLTGLT